MTQVTELCFTPATVLTEQIRTKKLSPVELLDAILARVLELDPKLHAFVTLDIDRARETARAAEAAVMSDDPLGLLNGIPVLVKDLEATKGLRTTYGSKFSERYIPEFDSIVVERLRAAGAIIFGKTNTPHAGHKDTCDNLIMPTTRNPWRLDRTSGGSSGGAGAAVAAGLSPLAQGGDGAGSIRIPAALCGVYGLKPSYGRVPNWPNNDLWTARTHLGPMTRTVRDAALMLSVMAGPDKRDPLSIDSSSEDYLPSCDGDLKELRVAWSPDLGYAMVDSEVRRVTEAAAHRFTELGCYVEEASPGWDDPGPWHRVIYQSSIAAGFADRIEKMTPEQANWIEPSLAAMIENGNRYTRSELSEALRTRTTLYEQMRRFMESYDLFLTPQMPCVAWPWDSNVAEIENRLAPSIFDRISFTFPFNLIGWPAASVPCGFNSEGLPIALQIVTGWHQDGLCLRASAAFEALQPWAGYRPALDLDTNRDT